MPSADQKCSVQVRTLDRESKFKAKAEA